MRICNLITVKRLRSLNKISLWHIDGWLGSGPMVDATQQMLINHPDSVNLMPADS